VADIFFPEYVVEQMAGFGIVSVRPMFGGHGVYKSGLMFGLIAGGELFFKVDDANRADYEAKKSEPFVYKGKGRSVALSYWYVPEDVMEDADELCAWAERAYAAALRKRKAATVRPKSRRGPARPASRRRRR
jgi:DNA transformation protein